MADKLEEEKVRPPTGDLDWSSLDAMLVLPSRPLDSGSLEDGCL